MRHNELKEKEKNPQTTTLTRGILVCVWTRCGHQTESDTGNRQTRRPCQKRQGGIHSECHLVPV